ncbi:hypothetical protein Cgig2_017676 [Carnegiea gigantea]|uniref:Uncharacterized protein n=1 Tax=Carnegiea gigantea TaxID=171969 RepID=A0A9Q1GRG7_9CARY|nr:hypothetical protein Cgig2_017676 [Carnegiea gigantea]
MNSLIVLMHGFLLPLHYLPRILIIRVGQRLLHLFSLLFESIFVDPTKEFKEVPAKFLLKICTEGNENKIYVEVALEMCLWSKIEFGRRKEDCMTIEFGVVKEDEEDYTIDILKGTPIVIALHHISVRLQTALSNVALGTIYAPKKHVIKKQIEKGLKRPREICNHMTFLIGAETGAYGVNYLIVQDSRGPHIHDDGILYIMRLSSLVPTEGNATY